MLRFNPALTKYGTLTGKSSATEIFDCFKVLCGCKSADSLRDRTPLIRQTASAPVVVVSWDMDGTFIPETFNPPNAEPISADNIYRKICISDNITGLAEAALDFSLTDLIPAPRLEEAKTIILNGFTNNTTKPMNEATTAIASELTDKLGEKIGTAYKEAADLHLGEYVKKLCDPERMKQLLKVVRLVAQLPREPLTLKEKSGEVITSDRLKSMRPQEIYETLTLSAETSYTETFKKLLARISLSLPLQPLPAGTEDNMNFISGYENIERLRGRIPKEKSEQAYQVILKGFQNAADKPFHQIVTQITEDLNGIFGEAVGNAYKQAADLHLGAFIKSLYNDTQNWDIQMLTDPFSKLSYAGTTEFFESVRTMITEMAETFGQTPGMPQPRLFMTCITNSADERAKPTVRRSGVLPHLLSDGQSVSAEDIHKVVIARTKASNWSYPTKPGVAPYQEHAKRNKLDPNGEVYLYHIGNTGTDQRFVQNIRMFSPHVRAADLLTQPDKALNREDIQKPLQDLNVKTKINGFIQTAFDMIKQKAERRKRTSSIRDANMTVTALNRLFST